MSFPPPSRRLRSFRPQRRLAAALLATALTPYSLAGAFAQDTTGEPEELPTIVVSPTGVPTPVDQVGSSVTVITADPSAAATGTPGAATGTRALQTAVDIERDQRRSVPDALLTAPGLSVFQSGGVGGQTSVFMRGTEPRHTKVLIDGIDVSDPSTPARTFEFGHLATGDIDRIEVLRGPQSGLYGADALGGVIAVTTKRGEGPPKVSGTLEGGSFGTFNQFGSLSGSHDRFDYAFNVVHLRTEDLPVTPQELLPPGRRAIGNFYDNITLSTKLGVQLSEEARVNYVARYTDSILRFTGDDFSLFPAPPVPAAEQSAQHQKTFATRAELEWALFDGRFQNFFGIAYTEHRRAEISPGASPFNFNGDRVKADWRGHIALAPGQLLVTGLEAENERVSTASLTAQNGNRAGYVELQSAFSEQFFVASNLRHDNNDRFGGYTTWRVAPTYIVPWTGTQLKGSVGTGFKAPSLDQLFADYPPFFFSNPNLRPEESIGYDIGFEQPLLDGRVRVGATWFHNDIRNLIVTTSDPVTFVGSYANVAAARTEGVEAFVGVAVTDRFRIRGDYTYTHAIDADTGLELLRRPRHKASVTAAWNPIDPLVLSATVLHVGSWIDRSRDGVRPRLVAPGYTVVNVAANYTINDHVQVFARADNLFDLRYQSPTGFLRPGLGVYGGVRVTN